METYHKSDSLTANILNARPVCNAWEDYRTMVYKVTDNFTPVGTISTTNSTSAPVNLTQNLSKTQTVTMSVNGSKTETASFNLGGTQNLDKGSINAGIAYSIAKTVGDDASYSLSWSVGQTIGPYEVPAGYTGEATYGFRTIAMTGTQQYCMLNGAWSNPVALRLKNVGTERYYGDFPVVSFRIDGKTASGPTGVDRLITPGWFNGAYTRDLGFDAATSTRSFLVTLANPIKAGETQLVANLNFGDGLTSEGRLRNYITGSQASSARLTAPRCPSAPRIRTPGCSLSRVAAESVAWEGNNPP